ncbi:Protein CBR-ZIP-7 [Caenorhabditis briggsae]|uniref:Protein CBR-ZIP-7 n=1 Tax=Caenorhabditis briggsae TaxID=6238 RepID=A8XIF4_CAEBR|nr:Protein CBR-ZIP-7 [Caenorhabditis briggsae]CAP32428.2 Protein CBR-ZIP-7 [Caenorhabditis briggsae]
MSDELQQQLANSSLYDAESLKAFNQMYTSANNPYAVGGAGVVHGFDKSYYERRARNNKAAQKSREARKKIDAENSHRVNQLEMENNHLKAYIYKLYQENMMMKNQLVQHYPGVVDPAAASMPGF